MSNYSINTLDLYDFDMIWGMGRQLWVILVNRMGYGKHSIKCYWRMWNCIIHFKFSRYLSFHGPLLIVIFWYSRSLRMVTAPMWTKRTIPNENILIVNLLLCIFVNHFSAIVTVMACVKLVKATITAVHIWIYPRNYADSLHFVRCVVFGLFNV